MNKPKQHKHIQKQMWAHKTANIPVHEETAAQKEIKWPFQPCSQKTEKLAFKQRLGSPKSDGLWSTHEKIMWQE